VSARQQTLEKAVEIEGVGLFFGAPVSLRCLPAEPNAGIRFVRVDLSGRPSVPALADCVPAPKRYTTLKNGEAEVFMVEHLLASAAGLGIDNMIVEADAPEMPIGDGSALTYAQAFLKAGIRPQDAEKRWMAPDSPVSVTESDVAIMAAPLPEGLLATYVLDFGQQFVKSQAATFALDRETFLREIAPARTFVLRPEVDAFIQKGLGKGATTENTIVLELNGDISVDLRFPDECVRHKLLDMLGDLYLVGAPLRGRVLGFKSGHATNIRLVRAIRDVCQTRHAASPVE